MNWFRELLASEFMPHGHCFLWEPDILWTNVISDGLIGASYYAIPFLLFYFVRKRKDLAFHWIFYMFAAFILACGTTHLIGILTVWKPFYRVEGAVKAMTAFISLATAVGLIKLIPQALALPSPAQLREKNVELEQEIERRNRAEAALRTSETLVRAAVSEAPIAIWMTDKTGKITFADGQALKSIGLNQEDLLGKSAIDLFPEDPVVQGNLERVISGQSFRAEMEFAGRILMTTYNPLRDEIGGVSGAIGVSTDITDLKRNEEDLEKNMQERTRAYEKQAAELIEYQSLLKESEEQLRRERGRLQAILDTAADGIVTISETGIVESMNAASESLFGYPAEEVIGRNVKMLMPSPYRENHDEYLSHYLRTGEKKIIGIGREVLGQRKDGHTFPVYLAVSEVILGGSRFFTGIIHDLTDQRRAQEERDRFFSLSLDMLCIAGTDGYFKRLNPAFENILGYSTEELQLKPFMDFVHPDDREVTIEEMEKLGKGQTTISFENRYLCRDGAYKWMLWTAAPFPQEGLIYAAARDITGWKNDMEALLAARSEAERANRAKSEFLSRMSHELRTPLNSILGYGQLLEMEEMNELQKEGMDQIMKGGRHLLELIDEVLDIARIEAGKLRLSTEPVAIGDVLTDAMGLLGQMADASGVEIQKKIAGSSGGYVLADRQRLKQVILNLLSNAVKYNRRGGSVTVTTSALEQTIRIDVIDTGIGIPPGMLDRLFQPFDRLGAEQRTDREGLGLGLSLSKALVELMGGELTVRSEEGKGSTFSIELEKSKDPTLAIDISRLNSAPAAPLSGYHTVLYIEDNLANLKLVQRIFEKRPGLRLESAMQGSLGLDLAWQLRPSFIILDLHLPDISGEEVLRRLRSKEATRSIPVIIMSADATEGQIRRLKDSGALEYLTKPIDVKQFLDVVDSLAAKTL